MIAKIIIVLTILIGVTRSISFSIWQIKQKNILGGVSTIFLSLIALASPLAL